MPILQDKLNLKDQSRILVLHAPDTFAPELALPGVDVFTAWEPGLTAPFILVFCTKKAQVDSLAGPMASAAVGDALLWFAYPKGSSKRYKCDFNRDNGWGALGEQGFEPVRLVAIDEDWSALRFRRAGFIKTMTRSFAMSEEGVKKVDAAKKAAAEKKAPVAKKAAAEKKAPVAKKAAATKKPVRAK
ncbi:MAG: hypothetical protein U0441_21595 [Polyangiaceae bacterium]